MLGAVIGDIVGSVFEWHNVRRKDFGPLFHPKAFFTDDTVCTVVVADALVNERHAGEALKDWGLRYWDNGGWGVCLHVGCNRHVSSPITAMAMVPRCGCRPPDCWLPRRTTFSILSRQVTEVTHNHPEGLKGAEATALAIFLARQGITSQSIRVAITDRFGYDLERTPDDIRPTYHFNETCQETVPQALVCALAATSFEDAIRNAISIGGDSDTVAAIAGGGGGLFGIPDEIADRGWTYLRKDMRDTLTQLYRKVGMLL